MNIKRIGSYYHTSWIDEPSWKNVVHDTPRLGHYSWRDSSALRQQIEWAMEYGVSYFVVNWYWNSSHSMTDDNPVSALLQAAEGTDFRIAVNWCTEQYSNWLKVKHNWRYGDIAMETINAKEIVDCFRFAAKHFFQHDQYLKVDNRTVFYLYWANFILDFFGQASLTEIVRQVRETMLEWNLEVDLVAVDQSATGEKIGALQRSGFDAVTFYGIPSTLAPWVKQGDKLVNESNYRQLMEEYVELWRIYNQAAAEAGLRFIPQVIAGYDNYPRHRERHSFLVRRTGATPSLFRELCSLMKQHNPQTDEVMVNAWNEWEESSAIEPSQNNGFEYLQAIRDELGVPARID